MSGCLAGSPQIWVHHLAWALVLYKLRIFYGADMLSNDCRPHKETAVVAGSSSGRSVYWPNTSSHQTLKQIDQTTLICIHRKERSIASLFFSATDHHHMPATGLMNIVLSLDYWSLGLCHVSRFGRVVCASCLLDRIRGLRLKWHLPPI